MHTTDTLPHPLPSPKRGKDELLASIAQPVKATVVEPPHEEPLTSDDGRVTRLLDLLLKSPARFDRLAAEPAHQATLVPNLLMIGVTGYTVFSLLLAMVYSAAGVWPNLMPVAAWLDAPTQELIALEELGMAFAPWLDGSVVWMTSAYTLGLIGAIGVCLPSFYFYGLLAGVRTTMVECTLFALKGMATSAVALVGLIPVYVAVMLGLVALDAPNEFLTLGLLMGLIMPFVAGLWGTRALYTGFVSLADRMEGEFACRRRCFLRRLLIAWSGCFTAVTPVMIYTLWEFFAN